MDATSSGTETIQFHNIPEQPIAFQRQVRHCFGDLIPGEFPLAANPSIVLHVLTACNLEPQDLAKLETTCYFFRQAANFAPDYDLSIAELAAFDMCQRRAIFKPMNKEERESLKQKCGGSWKLVLRYLLAGEVCCRRENSQAIAGPGHSIAVTSNGAVYSFGSNGSGQLGHGPSPDGNPTDEYRPRLIRLRIL